MNFNVQQHRLGQLASRLNLMVAIVFGLLVTNMLMGSLAWYAAVHQKVEVTPFSGGESYTKSDAVVDTHYLNMMSENFLYSRLNVTPETVDAHHQHLLEFVSSKHYPQFSSQLNHEARVIKSQKISSYFVLTGSHNDPKNLRVVMTGLLKRSVGLRALEDKKMSYVFQYRYHLGRLSIEQFLNEEDKHA
jgi:conjugal transfer pilus assembly protein TraE